jgi:hypothetical protein
VSEPPLELSFDESFVFEFPELPESLDFDPESFGAVGVVGVESFGVVGVEFV